jgi:cysteamine dioxygenase
MKYMDQVTLADLGLSETVVGRMKDSVCMTITATPQFDIAVFILPSGKSIPLHDHPNMTVLSKLVTGTLAVRAFSLNRKTMTARLVNDESVFLSERDTRGYGLTLDTTKTSDDPSWFLTPTCSNIHEFCAEKTCVILDILLPPYDEDGDRPCNYYAATDAGEYWKLVNAEEPKDLPYGIKYQGLAPLKKV